MEKRRMLAVSTVVLTLQCVSAMFYHAPSSVVLQSTDEMNNTDFGFSMAYMTGSKTLMVGAPKADRIGGIFNCEMGDADSLKKISCVEQYMEIDQSSYDSEHYPDQHFHLGATIVAAENYFFTCAPLWTTTINVTRQYGKKEEVTDAFGTCFIQDTETHRYRGLLENYMAGLREYANLLIDKFRGGTGWSTLIDEKNDLLLITKTATFLGEDIFYLPASDPLTNVWSLQKRQVEAKKHNLEKRWNIGFGLASGKFFSHQTVYAVSMLEQNMQGFILFLTYKNVKDVLWLSFLYVPGRRGKDYIKLNNDAVGTMFGTTMGAADLNLDGLDELLVAAPAQSEDECVECGALHIYLGGDVKTVNERKRLRSIYGTAHLGRFGTAIATKDLDDDGKTEIIVSAPYEDNGSGAIYILSGYDVYNTLMKTVEYKSILWSDLKLTQRIRNKAYRALGFSLQFVADVDDNACDELAAGSPGSSTVLLFKCVQKINVTLSSHLIGEQTVREQDLSFTVEVCARVQLPPYLPEDIYGDLIIESSIVGEAAVVKDQVIVIDISCYGCHRDRNNLCGNVTVELMDKEPAYYTFTSKAVLQNKYLADNNMTEFNSSWVETSPYSKMEASLEVSRHCKGDDCDPDLSLELSWSGGEIYMLGSTANETAKIKVYNKGNASYSSCVWVQVTGVPLYQVACPPYKKGYRCDMPKPMKRDTDYSIELVLNMTKPTNLEEELLIEVYLYENCDQENMNTSQMLQIPFDLPSDGVFYDGDDHRLNITDRQISENEIVSDHHEFAIRNNGTITWNKVNFTVTVPIGLQLFIHNFHVTASDFGECNAESLTNSSFIIYHCTIDLPPNTTRTVIGTTEILAARLSDYVKGSELNMTSESELVLSERRPAIVRQSITRITIQKEITWAHKKWLIALIACIVALIILAIITFILWKCGFFRRKQRQQLLVAKDSIRKQSVRRITYVSAKDETTEGIQMDVDDDCPFEDPQPVTTKDNVGLVADN